MAVERMKLISIVGPVLSFDDVVCSCIIDREFHPENVFSIVKDLRGLYPFEQDNPYADLLKKAYAISELTGIETEFFKYDDSVHSAEEVKVYFDDFENRYNSLAEEKVRLEKLVVEDEQILIQLSHLKETNAQLDEFFHFEYVKFRFGRLPRETYDNFALNIENNNNVFFFPTSKERDYVYGMYMMPKNVAESIDAVFASLHFERVRISDRVHGTPHEAEEFLKSEISDAKKKLNEISSEITGLVRGGKNRFLACYSYIRFKNDSHGIRRFAAHTEETFYMLGWVPENDISGFKGRIEQFKNITYTIDNPEALYEHFPPIRLKNKTLFKPFETFVETYGLPSYNEIDPTPFMAITYTLMFGIMFGDLGQGACLILVGFLMWKLKKMALGKIVSVCGISSMIFGTVYGSIFGNEHVSFLPGLFKPMHDGNTIITTLLTTVVMGVILMSVAMVVNIINGAIQRDYEKMFFSSRGLAGFLLYWTLILTIVFAVFRGPSVFTPGLIALLAALIGIPLLLIFVAHPLGKFLRRDPSWMPSDKGEYIMINAFELIEVFLSFATNTISFIRVGAFTLNHAGLMMVVYILARSSGSTDNVFVLIVGNVIVMALEALVVGVQVLRLEFYELFGKFYSGEGKPYNPLIIRYNAKE